MIRCFYFKSQKNLKEICERYDQVLIPEMNFGQLSKRIRSEYLVDAVELHKLQGQPFKVSEITEAIDELL